jgi:cytochrome c551/c552
LLDLVGSGVPPVVVDSTAHGKAIFDRMCVACHTVGGGGKIGPDLLNVTQRRSSEWLGRWMKDPIGMTQTDPIAKELLAKWKGVQMPPQGLTAIEQRRSRRAGRRDRRPRAHRPTVRARAADPSAAREAAREPRGEGAHDADL